MSHEFTHLAGIGKGVTASLASTLATSWSTLSQSCAHDTVGALLAALLEGSVYHTV